MHHLFSFMLQDGQRIEYFVYVCTSNTVLIWQGIVFGYKALLQIIAIFLAFGTRKVTIEGLNDAKYIAGIIYVTSIVLAVLIVSFVTLEVYLNALAAMYSTGFTVLATLIMGFVFIPKVRNDFAGLHVCIFIICCVEFNDLRLYVSTILDSLLQRWWHFTKTQKEKLYFKRLEYQSIWSEI